MVDNELIRSSHLAAQSLEKPSLSRSESSKVPEHLLVTYMIEKISGLRTNKKTNSFKAATSTSLKTLVHTVIKKVKFSTRHKYAIIYFDTRLGKWRKFKDRNDWGEMTQVKIRVCRYKASNPKPQIKANAINEAQVIESPKTQQAPMGFPGPRYTPFQFNPAMSAYFYTYMMYLNFQRMQNNIQ